MPAPPRRRWLRYSLRTLLVLTTLVAIWLGIKTNRARNQRTAVNALRAAGARVLYDFQAILPGERKPKELRGPKWLREFLGDDYFQDVVLVNLGGIKFPPDELRWIVDLPNVENVVLQYTNVDDAGLAYLSELKSLSFLSLKSCENVTDAGLTHLADLASLELLYLDGTQCTDEGVRQVIPRFDRLVMLDVAGIPITNETAKEFRHLKNLKVLHLSRKDHRTPHDLSESVQLLKKELPGCQINYLPPSQASQ